MTRTRTILALALAAIALLATGSQPAQADWGNLILVPASWPDDYEIGNDGFYSPERIWPWEVDWDDAEVVISPCLARDVCGDDGSGEIVIGGTTVVLVPMVEYLNWYGPEDTVLVGYEQSAVELFCAGAADEWNYEYCVQDPWPYGWAG